MVFKNSNKNKFRYYARITIPYDKFITESRVEGNLESYDRAKVNISKSENLLQINISATDISALRASFNSITRDLSVIEGTNKVLQSKAAK
ncbi:N6-threonylcarbamoyl-adenosine(37)-tRNA synthase dimerization module Pcc1 [Candidatus Mancarchaeum acidiphilum]|uniref:N6-threonylcarbamoyl-adenosine(37)-tRNA synthase dimerization module Pcc1 n=1 Tax=Candidatus Mancarchaeum acidiphilum TaxID=1920749 RepID=A0A218NP52_9ARCH|nr:KEOPS complex subunit Pcc1 [Candidatus Mancarchaeum acidiphilum]ASI14241.1 N6-threonylcarbamoyl-adenosine(37)-tRNA synthase dimerization module Pcc1 [Candidatus Mancarchaeum acidiphilum]